MRRLRSNGGFTLMELVVVAVMISMLAAIAVPFYAQYVRQGFTREAEALVESLIAAEKTYRARRGTFYTDFSNASDVNSNLGVYPETENFTATATTPTANTLQVAATGKEGTGAASITLSRTYDVTTGVTQ